MNDIQVIQSKIYEIRGQRVMLDRDLAELYHVTTGNLNKAVKRNIRRFPPDFMFQLTKEEFMFLKHSLIFQNGISNDELKSENGILRTGRGGIRQLPYAFTEQGLERPTSKRIGKTILCHKKRDSPLRIPDAFAYFN